MKNYIKRNGIKITKEFIALSLVCILASLVFADFVNKRRTEIRGAETYLHYFSLESAKAEFEEGEPIEMVSDTVIYEDISLKWEDVLFCKKLADRSGTYVELSTDTVTRWIEQKPRHQTNWVFNTTGPLQPSECFVRSNIVLYPGYSIEKYLRVDSNLFIIK